MGCCSVELYRADSWRSVLATWPLVLTVTTSEKHASSLARVAHRVAMSAGSGRIAGCFRCASIVEFAQQGPFARVWHTGGSEAPVRILDIESQTSETGVALLAREEPLPNTASAIESPAASLRLPEGNPEHAFLNNRTDVAS